MTTKAPINEATMARCRELLAELRAAGDEEGETYRAWEKARKREVQVRLSVLSEFGFVLDMLEAKP